MPAAALDDVLRERFGLTALHAPQEEAIGRLLDGGDVLVVLPTGAGKSLCYQLPALVLPGPGLGLVLSPLIALMEDQVHALRQRGIHATYVNSSLQRAERERREQRIAEGAYELVYATPERMEKPAFLAALDARAARTGRAVKLLAVDEAHCISRWGHDLRPAYARVGQFRTRLGSPPTIALTATATREVRDDIRLQLGRDEATMPLVARPLDRPNLDMGIRTIWDDDDRLQAIREVAAGHPGTGIVYFALIRDLERLQPRIRAALPGRTVDAYHGRLDPAARRRAYRRFIAAPPGDGLVLLATNAFGLGVDKPDLRFVVHAQVPGSVEAWYQEVGRAGRDGLPARTLLLYASDDLPIQQDFALWKNPPAELIVQVADVARTWPHATFDLEDLQRAVLGKGPVDRRLEYALVLLEDAGVVEATPHEGTWRPGTPLGPGVIDADALEVKRRRDLERLLDVVRLVAADDPRAFALDYFAL